jgi:hypothetical protein
MNQICATSGSVNMPNPRTHTPSKLQVWTLRKREGERGREREEEREGEREGERRMAILPPFDFLMFGSAEYASFLVYVANAIHSIGDTRYKV